jgi:hypothetical protein
VVLDAPDDEREPPSLQKGIGPEPTDGRTFKGEIQLLPGLEDLLSLQSQEIVGELEEVDSVKPFGSTREQLSLDAQARWAASLQEQI